MFYSITELVEQATLHYEGNVAELMIATEFELNWSRARRSSDSYDTKP